MHKRENKIGADANKKEYIERKSKSYAHGAPHLKNHDLEKLFISFLSKAYKKTKKTSSKPILLDLGAGEGSVTIRALELGFHVIAIDSSASQISELKKKCKDYSLDLECIIGDVFDVLSKKPMEHDVVLINSFLHHIPDYMLLFDYISKISKPHSQILTFQDPLRYDNMPRLSLLFSKIVYFSWRIFQGDVVGGLWRRSRRFFGFYYADSVHDNAEYHVTRNGVDEQAIKIFLEKAGFQCEIFEYFSTQSQFFNVVGSKLGIKNSFALICHKDNPNSQHSTYNK
tara:strand:+ start:325 stop:1176 length:852 start_codon:yes stop_codon:yes gene_type:complete